MRNLTTVELSNHVKVGQIWQDIDRRNVDLGKTGRAKPKYREVEILSLPTLGMPGSFKVLRAPKAPHTIGKVRKFTYAKLLANYARKDRITS